MLASVCSYTLTNSVLTPNMCALPNHRHSQNDTGAPGHPGDVQSPAVSAQHSSRITSCVHDSGINVLCKTRFPSSYTLLRFLDLPDGATALSLPGRSQGGPDLLSSAGRTQRKMLLPVHRIAGSERTAHDPSSLYRPSSATSTAAALPERRWGGGAVGDTDPR